MACYRHKNQETEHLAAERCSLQSYNARIMALQAAVNVAELPGKGRVVLYSGFAAALGLQHGDPYIACNLLDLAASVDNLASTDQKSVGATLFLRALVEALPGGELTFVIHRAGGWAEAPQKRLRVPPDSLCQVVELH